MGGILDAFRLDGRRALVTGASRGLGAAAAVALAEAGADVVLVARTRSEATAAAVQACGRRALVLTADLGVRGAGAAALREAEAAWGGPLDILVNNAGIIRRAPAAEHSWEDWDAVMRVNLDSAFELSQAFLQSCLAAKRGGSLINIASLLSFQGGLRVPSYAAAKSGLLGLTRAFANEAAAAGVNVNAIVPGYFETDNTAPLRADAERSRSILERIPAGRWGVPADLAGAVVFLASPAAAYVHGAALVVDGGWLGR